MEWYEALHVGQTGGALQAIIDRRLGDPFFGIFLNPGHQLHLDEWVNSPVYAGLDDRAALRAWRFQVDIIPATGTDYFTTNIEDGLALADEPLRAAFAAGYPEAWARIEARRRFMADRSASTCTRTCCRSPTSRLPAAVPAPPRPGDDPGLASEGSCSIAVFWQLVSGFRRAPPSA